MKQTMIYQEIVENFSYLDEWEDRYKYILDLGDKLLPFPPEKKTNDYLVKGCVSQVWLDYDQKESSIFLYADSDSVLVKGLLFILISLFSGKTKEQINAINYQDEFEKIKLNDHITPQRSNGVVSVIQKIYSVCQS